ncbi:MAG: M28 family peptidase [Bacteroidales bacterium]
MTDKELCGWQKMLDGYPWFDCNNCYPIAAYSEFMPPPFAGRKPLGERDRILFSDDDPCIWHITEIEEEYELKPGIENVGQQIMDNLVRVGRGLPERHIHGHNGENLKDNPYWPPELASAAGTLSHERFVTILPLMLSRTQDDKGRVTWTFFGRSTLDPETAFWKNFAPGAEAVNPENEFVSFITGILSHAYTEKCSGRDSLFEAGFRILRSGAVVPDWIQSFVTDDDFQLAATKYLLTFEPFESLPPRIRELYLSCKLALIPFPGSLVFWGMPGYEKLSRAFRPGGQVPLLNLILRNRGISGLKVTQSGWFHEPRTGEDVSFTRELLHEDFHRTHRWQRLHRYQDELNEAGSKARIAKALFSTEPEDMGLYDKPLARNSHIWNHKFELLLDGPDATRNEIAEAEKTILEGGLFGYRFFFPPMRVGEHEVYLHRIMAACLPSGSDAVEICANNLTGYITGYHKNDLALNHPVEMWPHLLKRELYLSALNEFQNNSDHYSHQTSLNILSLLDTWQMQDRNPLPRSYARSLLNIAKDKDLDEWLDELPAHCVTNKSGIKMQEALSGIIEQQSLSVLPEAITFSVTATRRFEENWWNDIRYLAQGQFINKDNADIAMDEKTQAVIKRHRSDLGTLGDYLIARHRKAITGEGMEGVAICGELLFRWVTDFDFSIYGGWTGNQNDETFERNILMVIPGRNRKQAVILGDHYDTAYMEDIYEKEKGGSGARLSANGADDDYSATSTLLQAAPIFLRLAKEGRLERDIWLLHLTGEEFPSDCMGARNFCQLLVEKRVHLKTGQDLFTDLSETTVVGVFIMDMIGHNRDDDQNIFQISPGHSTESFYLAMQAHLANLIWNKKIAEWNELPERQHRGRGKRITTEQIPGIAKFLHLNGEIRTKYNPHSSLYNTDGQIFSDTGVAVVLFMENYDINRTGYHDTKDTLENIDLDYGAAFAAIAIETVARIATEIKPGKTFRLNIATT